MDLTHLHLLLNHFPVIGSIIGGGLLVVGIIAKSDGLKRASLVVLIGIALIAIPTYISGNGAQQTIGSMPGVSKSLIETHEGTAFVAMGFMEFTGAFAWLGLWQFRRLARIPVWNLVVILILTLVTLGLMNRVADIGGEIRHVETRASDVETVTPEGALARTVGTFMEEVRWAWPTCETLHFIGLTLLLGVVLLVDLRVLGFMKGVSYSSLHRLLPWAAIGFGVNVITGLLFFVGIPNQYLGNTSFYVKIALVLVAGANALYFTVFEEPWDLGPQEDAPVTAKIAAASAMVLWVAVMYCGSMLPFLGNAF